MFVVDGAPGESQSTAGGAEGFSLFCAYHKYWTSGIRPGSEPTKQVTEKGNSSQLKKTLVYLFSARISALARKVI